MNRWVGNILHKFEPEPTTGLQILWKLTTFCSRVYTTILVTPTAPWSVPLGVASTSEDADTSSGNGDIELVPAEISTGVGVLEDHFLAFEGTIEGQFEAGATEVGINATSERSCSESDGEAAVDQPRLLIGAHVGDAIVVAA